MEPKLKIFVEAGTFYKGYLEGPVWVGSEEKEERERLGLGYFPAWFGSFLGLTGEEQN